MSGASRPGAAGCSSVTDWRPWSVGSPQGFRVALDAGAYGGRLLGQLPRQWLPTGSEDEPDVPSPTAGGGTGSPGRMIGWDQAPPGQAQPGRYPPRPLSPCLHD